MQHRDRDSNGDTVTADDVWTEPCILAPGPKTPAHTALHRSAARKTSAEHRARRFVLTFINIGVGIGVHARDRVRRSSDAVLHSTTATSRDAEPA